MAVGLLEFEHRMADLMKEARRIVGLDAPDMNPLTADHKYSDKFEIINTLGDSLISSILSDLQIMGLQRCTLESIEQGEKMYLKFSSEESCVFNRKIEKKTSNKTESSGGISGLMSFITRSYDVNDVWVFDFEYSHNCFLHRTKSDSKTELWSGSGHKEIPWPKEQPPRPKKSVNTPIEIDITWLARYVKSNSAFEIDIAKAACPTLNSEVNELLKSSDLLKDWCQSVSMYFMDTSELSEDNEEHINFNHPDDQLKLVVSPLLISNENVVSIRDSHHDSLLTVIAELSKDHKRPDFKNSTLITFKERFLCIACNDLVANVTSFDKSIDVMDCITMRVISSVMNTEFTTTEFDAVVQYFKKLSFKKKYKPVPFMEQIRSRTNHPEGFFRITDGNGKLLDVDRRLVLENSPDIRIPITASAKATIPIRKGNVSVNCFVKQKISGDSETQTFNISLRAEQLSSFIVVLGKMSGSDMMIPSHAITLRNRDDLTIPLVLAEIPSAKEFKEAIESLSPEQKRFADAYRSMQLDGTLFSIAIIQIKPQIEVVLNLPEGTLSKETELSEKLLKMMVTDGLSSDLLSATKSSSDPLEEVRTNISRIDGLIQKERDEELREQERLRQLEEVKRKIAEEARAEEAKRIQRFTLQSNRRVYDECADISRCLSENIEKVLERGQRIDNLVEKSCCISSSSEMFRKSSSKKKSTFGFSLPSMLSAKTQSLERCKFATEAHTGVMGTFDCDVRDEICDSKKDIIEDAVTEDQNKSKIKETEEEDETKPSAGEIKATQSEIWDFSRIPSTLEQKFSSTTETAVALRPLTLKTGDSWSKLKYSSLLDSQGKMISLSGPSLKSEKEAAFNLLDALTKSGTVPLKEASVAIIFGFSHSWAESILRTVAKRNRNPLEIATNTAIELARTLHEDENIVS